MKTIFLFTFIATLVFAQDVGVKITLLDSPLLGNIFNLSIDIVWCGNNEDNDRNVIVLTSKGSVYKSSDKGDSWEKLTEAF